MRESSGILIPAYNAAAYLEATLRPLLARIPADRIAVIDDGSTDGTAQCAQDAGRGLPAAYGQQGKGFGPDDRPAVGPG